MLANTHLTFEKNKIDIPEEVQFYVKKENSLVKLPSQPIFVSKELKEIVETSGLFREEDKQKFIVNS